MQIAELLGADFAERRGKLLPTLPTLLALVLSGSVGPRSARRRVPGEGSIATANRHTGRPHEHRREISRRLRQAA